jgi:hypothetical protein
MGMIGRSRRPTNGHRSNGRQSNGPGTPPPGTPPPDEGARYLAERLVATAREDIGRADTKASVLLSGAFALPAVLLGTGRPAGLPGPWTTALLALGALFWACGTAALISAILPRTRSLHADRTAVTFHLDALAAADTATLVAELTAAGRDPVRWLALQLRDLSGILAAKYRWTRIGVCSLAPGLAAVACALVTGGR